LEICFIYEENDQNTKDALVGLDLPWYMKSIEVPSGQLQTKPRAMNYALDFCTGSIIGIYDAEDAPEANQIERVVQKFAHSDENIACIQCVLDFYNANTNWISRCFTIEYAIQFRLILPALDRLKLPIPLGGTSVFFRREILEKLGRWDAYNVTEDADLGYRFYRMGYRCSWIDCVTYEEANYRMIPWIKQRSRWLKGFLLTLLVHFKNPLKLKKEVGIKAALSMLSLSAVPWVVYPLAPVVLPMWLLSAGYDLPLYSKLPSWFMTPLVISFIVTEIMSVLLGYIATKSDQHKHLRPWLLTMLFYWPIALFASCKALYEVFVRPVYWDKSEHGVNDQNYALEIKKLTRNSGRDPG
jgi:cellulose synthase/poly-beta-1,6-N-acetylglucosamine synthase-like glycosyltransferase